MKLRDIAETGVKLLGLYALLQAIAALPSIISVAQAYSASLPLLATGPVSPMFGESGTLFIVLISVCVLYFGITAVLLFKARLVACFLVSEDANMIEQLDVEKECVTVLAFQIMGLFALIIWFPEAIQSTLETILYGTWQDPQVPFLYRFYENWARLFGPIAGTILGVVLLLKVKGLVRLLRLARPMDSVNKNTTTDDG